MKTVTPPGVPMTPSITEGDRKLPLAFSLNLPRSTSCTRGLSQKNLLANSLANRLKQHRLDNSSNKENFSKSQNSKLSKRPFPRSASGSCKTLPRGQSVSYADRNNSAASSDKSAKKYDKQTTLPTYNNNYKRVDSASSDQLPKLSRRKSSSAAFNPSRRSSSAEGIIGRGSLYSGTARMTMTSASSFFHSSDSSGLALESRGADYTIKVVKKDGVFQPIDKYVSCRGLPRDGGVGERTIACEYELFMLPVSFEDNAKPGSREAYSDGNRRAMKVSWGKATDNMTNEELEAFENRMESVPPPGTPSNLPRSLSSSSTKRPIYSSGKSRVQSIGLSWRVPTAPPDDDNNDVIGVGQSPKKPMWSWLVTSDIKQKGRLKAGERQRPLESKTSSQSCLSRVNSNMDVRTRHSRDLHPVATAMAREGTSVSKTKWLVPSSSNSTLEPERIAMDRLELVKREGKIRPDNLTDLDETFKLIHPDDIDSNVSEYGDTGARKRYAADTTSYGTKSIVDSLNSPTKSKST